MLLEKTCDKLVHPRTEKCVKLYFFPISSIYMFLNRIYLIAQKSLDIPKISIHFRRNVFNNTKKHSFN